MSGFFSKIFPISSPLSRPPVPDGVTRICVSGFGFSHHTGRARAIASAIAEKYPDKYETWYYFDTRGFRPSFLDSIKSEMSSSTGSSSSSTTSTADSCLSEQSKTILTEHTSSPFCWLEETSKSDNGDGDDKNKNTKKKFTPLGGRDSLCDWAMKTFDNDNNESIISLCQSEPTRSWKEVKFDAKTPGTTKTETLN